MSFESGVLVSLPANELRNAQFNSSFFGRETLYTTQISEPLRRALPLVDECLRPNAPLVFVARPEIFTHGVTLDWLKSQSRGVRDHLCLSDGSTIRLVPGLRNHVFFYGLGCNEQFEALARLERRVPEIFTQLHSQVNTALRFRWKDRFVAPQTYAVCPSREAPAGEPDLRQMVINRHSAEDSAARMVHSLPVDTEGLRFATLHYIRITERSLRDKEIARQLATLVAESMLDPTTGIIFVLPYLGSVDSSLMARARVLVTELLNADGRLPGVAAPNVLVATEDLPASLLTTISESRRLVVDDLCDFWRSPPSYYELFKEIRLYARKRRHIPAQLTELVEFAYGRHVKVSWTSSYPGLYLHS